MFVVLLNKEKMAFQLNEDNPRETDSQSYINAHCIMDLLDNMTSMLIYARPGKHLQLR